MNSNNIGWLELLELVDKQIEDLHSAETNNNITPDLHNNLNEALSNLADAEDRLHALKQFRNKPDEFTLRDEEVK